MSKRLRNLLDMSDDPGESDLEGTPTRGKNAPEGTRPLVSEVPVHG
jgi:hypothetical protein